MKVSIPNTPPEGPGLSESEFRTLQDHATWKGLHLHIRCDASRYHVVATVHDRCHTTAVDLYNDTDARRPRQDVREDLIDWVSQVVAAYDLESQ